MVVALVGTTDGFQPVSFGTLTPVLRISAVVSRQPHLGLRKTSTAILGLRATAANELKEALEKAYNEPAVPHSRERMYEIAQVAFCEHCRGIIWSIFHEMIV